MESRPAQLLLYLQTALLEPRLVWGVFHFSGGGCKKDGYQEDTHLLSPHVGLFSIIKWARFRLTRTGGEGVRRRVPAAREKVWVSDGAAWIWGLCEDYWPEAVQIVDWYHAKTHLHRAGGLLLGEGTAGSKSWVERQAGELYRGQVWRITEELESEAERLPGEQGEALRQEAGYFRRNQRRMQYMEYREKGGPTGSGAMESGCKQLAQRLKGPGMRGSRRGAEWMLALRATILSGRFDQTWCTLQNSPDS